MSLKLRSWSVVEITGRVIAARVERRARALFPSVILSGSRLLHASVTQRKTRAQFYVDLCAVVMAARVGPRWRGGEG